MIEEVLAQLLHMLRRGSSFWAPYRKTPKTSQKATGDDSLQNWKGKIRQEKTWCGKPISTKEWEKEFQDGSQKGIPVITLQEQNEKTGKRLNKDYLWEVSK